MIVPATFSDVDGKYRGADDAVHQTANGRNVYTIEKRGTRKLIYQTVWRRDGGAIGGLVEFSMELPDELPHYVRE